MGKQFIPFSVPYLGDEEKEEIIDVLRSGWLTTGPRCTKFENMFKNYIGCKHAIAVNSCTAALHLSLVSCGIGKGDEVITSPFTFAATANVIHHCGATPVFADIEPDTFNINPNEIKKKITRKTKAIIVVHYGGHPCVMDEIDAISKNYGLPIIEDAAHALGAEYCGKKAGRLGKIGCFSFYPTKTITTGEGGMITTDDDEIAEKCRIFSLHGISKDAWLRYEEKGNWYYEIKYPGYKYNMTDLQAALGIHQLNKIEEFIQVREYYSNIYDHALSNIPWIRTPLIRENIKHSRHLYPILIKNNALKIKREYMIKKLREKNIGTSVHFIPLHIHPFYKKQYKYKNFDFATSYKVYKSIISLPLYPKLKEEELRYVINEIRRIANG